MLEWKLQAYISTELKRREILHHGDQNAGKRGPQARAIAKATGICKGWPDLCVIHENKIHWFELKTAKGRLSPEQKAVHKIMDDNGIMVHIVKTDSPQEAWKAVKGVIGI